MAASPRRPVMPSRTIAAFVMIAASLAHAAASPSDATDVLKGLPQDQALRVVLSALKERDAKLSNLSYTLHESTTNIIRRELESGATFAQREPMGDIVVEFRRHPAGHWIHVTRYQPRANEPYHQRWTNWKDGKSTW